MEPVFMILGQSAATGAVLALDGKLAVQDIPYAKLREQLVKDGQVLEYVSTKPSQPEVGKRYIDASSLPGIVLDDDAARLTGEWKVSSAASNFIGRGYRHDHAAKDGNASARYETTLPDAGRYEVLISWAPNSNRSSKVYVEVVSAKGETTKTIDQRQAPGKDGQLRSLGVYEFAADEQAAVVVSNKQSDGYVVIDAVQWLKATR